MIAPLYEGAKKRAERRFDVPLFFTLFYMEIVVLIGP